LNLFSTNKKYEHEKQQYFEQGEDFGLFLLSIFLLTCITLPQIVNIVKGENTIP